MKAGGGRLYFMLQHDKIIHISLNTLSDLPGIRLKNTTCVFLVI